MATDTKMCKACRSTIDLLATKCRHCGDPTPLTELEKMQVKQQESDALSTVYYWILFTGFVLYIYLS